MSEQQSNSQPSRIAGICPSMVDVSCELTNRQFQRCSELLGLEPGGWTSIGSAELLQDVLNEIEIPAHSLEELERAALHGKFAVTAGSSILGMFGSIGPSLRAQSVLASAIAIKGQQPDPFFQYFHRAARGLGVGHVGEPIVGENPMGLVLTTQGNREKMLATFQGVGPHFDAVPAIEPVAPEYIIVDSYELQRGVLSASIDGLIRSGKYKIALSLGNKAILGDGGTVGSTIRSYIAANQIYILCGNREEFATLFHDVPPEAHTKEGFQEHPVHETVPFSLMTDGPNGLVGSRDGEVTVVPAHPVREEDIINTSGAGDTAMGAFCDGTIRGLDMSQTLSRASHLASQVLHIAGSRLEVA